ncbi:ABC transporter ATP-binding protein [Thiohalomonas denitrificans]|uniref:ABC-2 type transport system ATP-binding protein n=1 Tax=Thiohalomonas denitrificans TaxID=415747 RepID=A0A1G5QMA9_9GAMM|nr:ABC transporter ATP-binding protein [Thiohalomonas denitrificans]SCZ62963.1 ABC-2 type transport system ATP-binding protein [Thiohalomonas denitrificans]
MKALEIEGLEKTYRNGFVALKGIDLSVEEGDFFALLGPNGAGKSTTIGIITSLVDKTGGSVRVFGADVSKDPMEARRCIGLVPQEFNFNQFEPVGEIITNQAGYYGVEPQIARERSEHYLKKLGLWEKRHGSARNLSGGMKRRLMIARALTHEPKLLILDEPTAGVDIELRRSMWAFLREVNAEGTTIILTTHYLEEAESLCRNIAIIDQGEIIENTSMRTLLTQLNRETLILDLKEPLESAPQLDGYSVVYIEPHTIEVEVWREQGLNPLFETLSRQNLEVISMRNKANRLEELFMAMVEGGETVE